MNERRKIDQENSAFNDDEKHSIILLKQKGDLSIVYHDSIAVLKEYNINSIQSSCDSGIVFTCVCTMSELLTVRDI